MTRPLAVLLWCLLGQTALAEDASHTTCGAFLAMKSEAPSYGELLDALQQKLAASPVGKDTFLSRCTVEGYVTQICQDSGDLTLGQAVKRLKALHRKHSMPPPKKCGA